MQDTIMSCVVDLHHVVAVQCVVRAECYDVLCTSAAASNGCGVWCAENLVLNSNNAEAG